MLMAFNNTSLNKYKNLTADIENKRMTIFNKRILKTYTAMVIRYSSPRK